MPEEKQQQASSENNPPAGGGGTAPNFNELEKGILKFWEDNKIFEKSLEQTKSGEPYVFFDGPPFATGLPHYGHILGSAVKDLFGRYYTMKGRYVRRRWGWDCHGLPIENIVEGKLKISGKKQIEEFGVDKFNQACRENVLKFADEWGKTVKRMGRWVEFDPPTPSLSGSSGAGGGSSDEALAKSDENASADVAQQNNKNGLRGSYKTMDATYMESVWWALKQIWDKNLIYEDRKVLLYCSRCETPISNFEVAMDNSYRDITEESVYVKFKMLKGQRIVNDLTNDKTFALAWTTTPWTLPGNTSLNVGPDMIYVLIEDDDKNRYILAKERLSIIEGHYEVVSEFPARALENLQYEPLFEDVIPDSLHPAPPGYPPLSGGDFARAHRFYLADFVTVTDGTGIVHNAAMYGEEDYQLAKEKNLPRVDMLDHKGQYLGIAPKHLRGVFFKDADKIVIGDLKNNGLLYKSLNFTHSYPHCWRCGTPLFYNALPAWFINIQKIKQDLIQNNESVNWYPAHLKQGRFRLGLESAPDWNISRNRYWATPLPFWKCAAAGCKNIVCVGSVAELKEKSLNFEEVYGQGTGGREKGLDSTLNPQPSTLNLDMDLHRPYIDRVKLKCGQCGGKMQRVPEVVDCWVESASMPFAEFHHPFENKEEFGKRKQADFVAEYIPQTRAWFYVMHVMSTILFNQAPFKNVVTTGNILAEDGAKMSKSKNNFPDPWILIEKYGIDAVRFYLMSTPVMTGDDVNFSEKGVQEVNRKVSLLLYNVWSFYRTYQSQTKADFTQTNAEHILDKWVIARFAETHKQVSKYLDAYDTVRAAKNITEFINDLSTWFLRRSRDRIKGSDENAAEALNTLGLALVETCKLLAPIMPFMADFFYKDLTGFESVHLAGWSSSMPGADQKILDDMATARRVVEIGLSLRKENNFKVRQPLAELKVELAPEGKQLSAELLKIIAEELNVAQVSQIGSQTVEPGWAVKEDGQVKVALDLRLTEELKRQGLARELERLVQDLRKKSGLKVGELVDVYYNIPDEALEEALINLLDRKKTFVSQINKSLEVEVDFETQGEVAGQAVWVGMVKV